jgi:hypothetical protein
VSPPVEPPTDPPRSHHCVCACIRATIPIRAGIARTAGDIAGECFFTSRGTTDEDGKPKATRWPSETVDALMLPLLRRRHTELCVAESVVGRGEGGIIQCRHGPAAASEGKASFV